MKRIYLWLALFEGAVVGALITVSNNLFFALGFIGGLFVFFMVTMILLLNEIRLKK